MIVRMDRRVTYLRIWREEEEAKKVEAEPFRREISPHCGFRKALPLHGPS